MRWKETVIFGLLAGVAAVRLWQWLPGYALRKFLQLTVEQNLHGQACSAGFYGEILFVFLVHWDRIPEDQPEIQLLTAEWLDSNLRTGCFLGTD